ncbi:DUF3857 domain-containing protein [Flavihumibacter fluvii]|uniref:DUF3857 domain-containing protein n=1 Tax=Flavihumibacter fluvii TaxID=2838157 RepID=UPI001BDE27C3|nr:DUF3857 domain-containing protein [Flavihumibacter fluvii]ULQ53713.1 DUF3857 domain-containing protein [Flavihumibacter fluvii]
MNSFYRLMVLTLLIVVNMAAYAQDKSNVKFGKISKDDFQVTVPVYDSGAHAVIIADVGLSKINPNTEGGFGYEFQRKMRIKIIDKAGIEAGKFEIPLYAAKNGDDREELKSIKAITYNLENGKIIETKLESDQVFTEKTSKYLQEKKFSLPALKPGAIFEISYTIISDFLFDFRSWSFQHEYPCMWSEFQTEVPQFYDYVYLVQGYQPFHIASKQDDIRSFLIRDGREVGGLGDAFTISAMVHINRWVIKDVPALKEENYTTSIENHRCEIEFQLSSVNFPGQDPRPVMDTWPKVTRDLGAHESFGQQIERFAPWVKDYLNGVIGISTDSLANAKKIYAHIRDNFTCIRNNGMYASGDQKNLLKTRNGNVGDINLLLISMLKQANIECYPVILSTRSHRFAHAVYPLLERFNYVVCKAFIGDTSYMLDATIPNLAFGKLDNSCYNGYARILTYDPTPILLSPDSILERSTTIAFLLPEKNEYKGTVTSNPGYYESLQHRNYISQNGKYAFFDKIKRYYGAEFEITNASIDSLSGLEMPVSVKYDIGFKHNDEDILYFNPVFVPFYKDNPFSADVRNYPVEMPYRLDETFILQMELPDGYIVEEMPKSTRVKLNEDEGYFEYLVSSSEGRIQLRTRLVLVKTNFPPDDYDRLREFFSYVVKKQAEQIVLKKK